MRLERGTMGSSWRVSHKRMVHKEHFIELSTISLHFIGHRKGTQKQGEADLSTSESNTLLPLRYFSIFYEERN